MVTWVELGSVPVAGVHVIGAGPWLLDPLRFGEVVRGLRP
jgi:hypothetical protein